ncbi:MAG: hypothetical protein QXV22_00225 [Thermoplasmataceae archaeon]
MKIYISKGELRDVAQKRIMKLFHVAFSLRHAFPDISAQEIELMKKIGRRSNVTIPSRIKRLYCPACSHFYDEYTKIRLYKGDLAITCNVCGERRDFRY